MYDHKKDTKISILVVRVNGVAILMGGRGVCRKAIYEQEQIKEDLSATRPRESIGDDRSDTLFSVSNSVFGVVVSFSSKSKDRLVVLLFPQYYRRRRRRRFVEISWARLRLKKCRMISVVCTHMTVANIRCNQHLLFVSY